MLKKRIIIPLLIVFTIFCCSFDSLFNSSNENAEVSIYINSSRRTIADLINTVTQFNLSVSGSSMTTISRDFTFDEVITIQVRAGENRRFTLSAIDSTNNTIFKGITFEDLEPGEKKSITINLEKVNGIVSFNNNGGTGTLPDPMSYDDAYTIGFPIEYNPIREGYDFSGNLNSRSDGSGDFSVHYDEELSEMFFDSDGDMVEDVVIQVDINGVAASGTELELLGVWPINDVTLYAQWEETPIITFNLNGGTGAILNPMSYADAYITGFPIVGISPTKTDHLFTEEWNTSADGTGSLTIYYYGETNEIQFDTNNDGTYDVSVGVNPETGVANPGTEATLYSVWPTSPITVYAQWDELFTLTYDGNGSDGGTVPSSVNALADTNITVAAQGSMTSSIGSFSHWNTKSDGTGTSYDPGQTFLMPAADATLYAIWIVV